MGPQGDEALGLVAVAPPQDPGHEGPRVVVPDPGGVSTPGKGDDMALEERLLAFRAIGHVDRGPRVGQAQLEDRHPDRLAADDRLGHPEVDLGLLAGEMVGHDGDVAMDEVEFAAELADGAAHRGLGDLGSLLVDEALPDPARRVALLVVDDLVFREPAPDRRGVGTDGRCRSRAHRSGWRDRGREGLAGRSPVHAVAARQLADRHPFLPVLPADTLELLHPRQLLSPSLVMASQDQSSVRTWRSGVAPVPIIRPGSGASSGHTQLVIEPLAGHTWIRD